MDETSHPQFYHCLTKHTRFFPTKHSFQYTYSVVGIPITWSGAQGRIFSVQQNSGEQTLPWTFFSVNSADFINRDKCSLYEKLKNYLCENELSIDDYSNIYLVTAPRFLGYQFNPVSFWYLHDMQGNLSIVIMEVNNTFDERHLYILRQESQETNKTQISLTQHTKKMFHVSPFNNREGDYKILAFDPLRAIEGGKRAIDMTITLLHPNEETGKKMTKFFADVRSVGSPINIAELVNPLYTLCFVVRYGWRGLVTMPRIIYQAGILRVIKRMGYFVKPEVHEVSICRQSTALERALQSAFHENLLENLNSLSIPFSLKYTSPNEGTQILRKSNSDHQQVKNGMEITIQVLSPKFYAEWACMTQYPEDFLKFQLSETDLEKKKIDISAPEGIDGVGILGLLLRPHKPEKSQQTSKTTTWGRLLDQELAMLRWIYAKRMLPPLEASARTGHMDGTLIGVRRRDAHKALLVELIAFGDEDVFWFYGLFIKVVIGVALLRIPLSYTTWWSG